MKQQKGIIILLIVVYCIYFILKHPVKIYKKYNVTLENRQPVSLLKMKKIKGKK